MLDRGSRRSRLSLAVGGAWLGLAVACVHSDPAPSPDAGPPDRPQVVGVLPAVLLAPNLDPQPDATAVFRARLEAEGSLRVLDPQRTSQALRDEAHPHCAEDVHCVRRVGKQLDAGKMVTAKVVQLGDVVLMRAVLMDLGQGAGQRAWQETVSDATAPRVMEQLERMASDVAQATRPYRGSAPWYRQWWVWAAGVAIVAGAVGLTTYLSGGDDTLRPADYTLTPPAGGNS